MVDVAGDRMTERRTIVLASAVAVIALVPASIGFSFALVSWSRALPSRAFGPRGFPVFFADRLDAMGGSLRIESGSGAGTTMRGSAPIEDGRHG